MSRHYFEPRTQPLEQITVLAADMMRHLHTRQYLGKVVVVCDSPFTTMRVARKQWLKLARNIQRQRASTVNTDKILRLAYTITHMQHLQFAAKSPHQNPEAHVFFITPEQWELIPLNCFTVYLASPLSGKAFHKVSHQLPNDALVVDYTGTQSPSGLLAKHHLEARVTEKWHRMVDFFEKYEINIALLSEHQFTEVDALDNALDTLLSASHDFLRLASSFQHTYELAQPLLTPHGTQQEYNTVALLAYRVQALSPGILSGYMLRTYHEDETFFLHDVTANTDPMEDRAIFQHHLAGRTRLAQALLGRPKRNNAWFQQQ